MEYNVFSKEKQYAHCDKKKARLKRTSFLRKALTNNLLKCVIDFWTKLMVFNHFSNDLYRRYVRERLPILKAK